MICRSRQRSGNFTGTASARGRPIIPACPISACDRLPIVADLACFSPLPVGERSRRKARVRGSKLAKLEPPHPTFSLRSKVPSPHRGEGGMRLRHVRLIAGRKAPNGGRAYFGGNPSTAKLRNVAYFWPTAKASLVAAAFHHASAASRLGHW